MPFGVVQCVFDFLSNPVLLGRGKLFNTFHYCLEVFSHHRVWPFHVWRSVAIVLRSGATLQGLGFVPYVALSSQPHITELVAPPQLMPAIGAVFRHCFISCYPVYLTIFQSQMT